MKRFLPLVLAVVAAVPVGALAGSIDPRYEATSSTRVQTLFEIGELSAIRRLAGLPGAGGPAGAPVFPADAAALEQVAVRTARRLGRSTPLEPDEARVIDTGAELIAGKFADPVRRLKVKVIAESPEAAARLSNAYLTEYLEERDRLIDALLSEARDRLSDGSTGSVSGISPAVRAELVEATDIASDLHGGVLTYDVRPARAPTESISPRPLRDAIVAGLIGGLVGWLLARRGGMTLRRAARRAPACG